MKWKIYCSKCTNYIGESSENNHRTECLDCYYEPDNVNKPSHYTQNSIETITYIEDTLTKEQYEGFLKGNIIKYLSRYNHKNGVEDLKKAKIYLEWLIEQKEGE